MGLRDLMTPSFTCIESEVPEPQQCQGLSHSNILQHHTVSRPHPKATVVSEVGLSDVSPILKPSDLGHVLNFSVPPFLCKWSCLIELV